MQMFTMASVTPSFSFKEFCPLYYLLNAIPTKIQKGFRSILVYLTALDTNGDYIAVGSSIGMLYLYCRHLNQMKKYNFEGKNESITVVKLLSCFDDLVAVGTASGKIAVFQLVSSLPGRNKQLRRFNVSGFHKSSITALAWSPNGMKLFSGDDRGKIVYSALDLDKSPGTNSTQAAAEDGPCNLGLQNLTSQESHVRMQWSTGLEELPVPPSERWCTMKSITRIVIFAIIRKLVDAELLKNCHACGSEAQQSLESHTCIKEDKEILSKYVREIASKICFKNLIHMIIFVSYNLNNLILTKKSLDDILKTVMCLRKSEKAIEVLKSLLKISDKQMLPYVESVIKRSQMSMICKK